MSYETPPRPIYIDYAPVHTRTTVSVALGLAVTSYIPGLGPIAIPALILALAADGRREHPLTRDRAHRAQMVAIISLSIQIVLVTFLLVTGIAGDAWSNR